MAEHYVYCSRTADGCRFSRTPQTLSFGAGVFSRFTLESSDPPVLPVGVVTDEVAQAWWEPLQNCCIGICTNGDPAMLVPPPDGASVSVRVANLQSLIPGLAVVVENTGQVAIPRLRVGWKANYDTPQPSDIPAALGFEAGPITGQGFSLRPWRPMTGPLEPGRSERFYVPPSQVRDMLSQASSLSPDNYWLAVRCGTDNLCRVPGTNFSGVLEAIEAALVPTYREASIVGHLGDRPTPVPATIACRLESDHLARIEAEWEDWRARMAESGGPVEHAHWDWRYKAGSVMVGDHLLVTVECEKMKQGAMAVAGTPNPSVVNRKPVLYVDYVEVAPWNLKWPGNTVRYHGVGLTLLAEAVRMSKAAGWDGRIGLNSLPQAEPFYIRHGLARMGTDPTGRMAYYELTDELAAAFIEKYLGASV